LFVGYNFVEEGFQQGYAFAAQLIKDEREIADD
jgi:hypothetical protein